MKPVTIRYYGILPIRKRTYVILQSVVFVLGIAVLIWSFTVSADSPPFGLDRAPLTPGRRWFLDHLWLIVLIAAVAEVFDAVFTLRAFARAEAEAKRLRGNDDFSEPREADTHFKEPEDRFRHRM